jgi:protein-arginine kinase
VRGAHGEHTNTDDGIFDVSNSRRLGRSEVELVQDMYDGIKAMITEEKRLAAGGRVPDGPPVKCGSHLTHWD